MADNGQVTTEDIMNWRKWCGDAIISTSECRDNRRKKFEPKGRSENNDKGEKGESLLY